MSKRIICRYGFLSEWVSALPFGNILVMMLLPLPRCFVLRSGCLGYSRQAIPSVSSRERHWHNIARRVCCHCAEIRTGGRASVAKIWIREFYARINKVETLSAREVVRLQLETGNHGDLPPTVRVNLTSDQYQPTFKPGAIIRLRARLMPPAGSALPGGYDFARRAWFQGIGATGSALGEVRLHRPSLYAPLFGDSRARLTDHIMANMPTGSGAIGAAIVTGDQAYSRSRRASHA